MYVAAKIEAPSHHVALSFLDGLRPWFVTSYQGTYWNGKLLPILRDPVTCFMQMRAEMDESGGAEIDVEECMWLWLDTQIMRESTERLTTYADKLAIFRNARPRANAAYDALIRSGPGITVALRQECIDEQMNLAAYVTMRLSM